jgi:hypothetical protein
MRSGREQMDKKHYSGELVAGVADEHAGLAHGAVSHRDALDEPGGAGRHGRAERLVANTQVNAGDDEM